MAALPPGLATGPAKLKAVNDLVDKLSQDLEDMSLSQTALSAALEELKIHGRDPRQSDPIFTDKGITTLCRLAFESESQETSNGALRVLANAMLLNPGARQMVVNKGYAPKACDKLKVESWDAEFLLSRIVFLTTYETSVNLSELLEKHQLAQRIVDNLGRHAKLLSSASKQKSEMMEEMALVETAKLLFNVTHFSLQHKDLFTGAVPHLLSLLWKHDLPQTKPLDSGLSHLTNGLLNLDLSAETSKAALFPEGEEDKVATRLIDILDRSMRSYDEAEMDLMVTPLIGLLIHIYGIAPEALKADMQKKLLPTTEDREGVLGQSSNLAARLLKASTNPAAPKLGQVVSQLLFDLSDRDPSKFVDNVGYGYASGFLFQNNIPVPEKLAIEAGAAAGKRPVNPITGQFLDSEKHPDEPEMTKEEKEREAEKLFVLFERLKKNGVIDVQNPMEKMQQEGRFEELPDSDDEDEKKA